MFENRLARTLRPRRPSPAMGVALTALFVALGGTTIAATQLAANSVGSAQLRPGAVATTDVRNGAITSLKVADGSLTGSDINVAKLAKVPSAAAADTVGGRTVGCPGGTRSAVAACFEDATRAPQGLLDAAATCAAAGRRLPTVGELIGLKSLGVALGDPELSGDATRGGTSPTQTPVTQRVLFADGVTIADEQTSAPRRFRCVASPVS